ncbi:MAG: hypothetical protein LBU34_15375 [Planctomycetaceae bacterium]|jgi:hypothetical protein|nr:hypothetical protein [Planctomycetaceae bacterium]
MLKIDECFYFFGSDNHLQSTVTQDEHDDIVIKFFIPKTMTRKQLIEEFTSLINSDCFFVDSNNCFDWDTFFSENESF